MKKLFSVFIIAGVVCLALIGALSVVPHVHGDDFNHSEHASCPIHQLGQHGFQAIITSFGAVIALSFVLYLFAFIDLPAITLFTRFFSVRAPPSLL